MKSITLIKKLIRKYKTAYGLHKKTGLDRWKISKILNSRKNLNADELLLLIESGDITKTDAKNIHFHDGMKKKKRPKEGWPKEREKDE